MEPISSRPNYSGLKNEAESILYTLQTLENATGKIIYDNNSEQFQTAVSSYASSLLGTWYSGGNYDPSLKEGLEKLSRRIEDLNDHLKTAIPSEKEASSKYIFELASVYKNVQDKLLKNSESYAKPEEKEVISFNIQVVAAKIMESLSLLKGKALMKLQKVNTESKSASKPDEPEKSIEPLKGKHDDEINKIAEHFKSINEKGIVDLKKAIQKPKGEPLNRDFKMVEMPKSEEVILEEKVSQLTLDIEMLEKKIELVIAQKKLIESGKGNIKEILKNSSETLSKQIKTVELNETIEVILSKNLEQIRQFQLELNSKNSELQKLLNSKNEKNEETQKLDFLDELGISKEEFESLDLSEEDLRTFSKEELMDLIIAEAEEKKLNDKFKINFALDEISSTSDLLKNATSENDIKIYNKNLNTYYDTLKTILKTDTNDRAILLEQAKKFIS